MEGEQAGDGDQGRKVEEANEDEDVATLRAEIIPGVEADPDGEGAAEEKHEGNYVTYETKK